MALVKNFKAQGLQPNVIGLNWKAPLDFNNTIDEIIVTKTLTHFPMELENTAFPTKATDIRPIEVFRGKTITSTSTSVSSNVLEDNLANFPVSPSLAGRLVRDSNSKVHRIVSNTTTTLTLETNPSTGIYYILPDFVEEIRPQENYEVDIRTTVDVGTISNLVIIENNSLNIKLFSQDELVGLIFRDSSGNKYFIKSNTVTSITLYTNNIPTIGPGMTILRSHVDSRPLPYVDNYRTEFEAANRAGTKLQDNKFYYYTVFTKPELVNVAQAEFANFDSNLSTQAYALSIKNKNFGTNLYNYWPSLYREMDQTGDLEDLMQVFGFQLNEIHSLIETYQLQDADNVLVTAALPLSEQFGLPSIGYALGVDTLRRIGREMLSCWKLKGSKEGIAEFIRIITTWDVTNGTADFSTAIQDFLPNVEALRFFDPNLGNLNTRLVKTLPFQTGGRFARSLPGIVIPGFFTFREFVITIPNVALFIGDTTSIVISNGTTTISHAAANYGAVDNLVGNFIIPNTEEVNDIYEIISNTNTSVTVRGVINNKMPGGNYAILSPLNTSRFIILNQLLPTYIPAKTRAGFIFV